MVTLQEVLARLDGITPDLLEALRPGLEEQLIIKSYPEHGYWTLFEPVKGLFVRYAFKDHPEPLWSPEGPEIIDFSLGLQCSGLCAMCYSNSTPDGPLTSMDLVDTVCEQLKELPTHGIALGGGNPNEHPQFIEILKKLRETGVYPTYTSNGLGMTPEVIGATKEYCGAAAVSWPFYAKPGSSRYDTALQALQNLISAKVQTNIHFVLSSESIEQAIGLLKEEPGNLGLDGLNAVIFLMYKPVGRADPKYMITTDNPHLEEFLDLSVRASSRMWGTGFDSCSVPMLASMTDVDRQVIETCESARFSMFISHEGDCVPCSFMQGEGNLPNLKDQTIKEIWQTSELFLAHRRQALNSSPDRCRGCTDWNDCLGGCVYKPEIVLCSKQKR